MCLHVYGEGRIHTPRLSLVLSLFSVKDIVINETKITRVRQEKRRILLYFCFISRYIILKMEMLHVPGTFCFKIFYYILSAKMLFTLCVFVGGCVCGWGGVGGLSPYVLFLVEPGFISLVFLFYEVSLVIHKTKDNL